MSGIKRHIAVDTQRLPHAIHVTTANVTGRAGALAMFDQRQADLSRVQNVLVDGGYTGKPFAAAVQSLLGASVEVVKRNELHTFVVLPAFSPREDGGMGGGAILCLAGEVPPTLEELREKAEYQSANGGSCLRDANPEEIVNRLSERFGISLCRSSCLNWLHRLGFAFKRPKKRLVKGNESKREAFVAEYAALWEEAQRTEARIFFADEAHFRADAELRGKWVLKGKPELVDSNSPRYGEKASYYSAVCLETGEVEWMELEGNSNSGTSVAFLTQLKEKHPGPLRVIWDNAPAHRGRRCGSTSGRLIWS